MTAKQVPVEVIGVGADASQCLRSIVDAYTEYKIVAEQEQTKRREIRAWEKATVANIQAQRDALLKYLELSFDERAKNFTFLFEKVDQAIADGNANQLALAINSITEIAKTSPFKDLANLSFVQTALDDPDHEWTI